MPEFKLRDYQITALNTIHNDLQTMNNVLLSAIMGAGKTVITCRLINKYFFSTSRRFLILCHKQELVEQFLKTFKEKTDIPLDSIGICCSGLYQSEIDKRITVGTIQTFINQIDKYEKADLLVVDECHRIEINTGSQYDKVINSLREKNNNLRLLGITATPFRMGTGYIYGNKNNKDVLFEKLNHKITYKELKEQGYLMSLTGEVAVNASYGNDIKNVSVNGDFAIEQIADMMSKSIHLDTAIEGIKQYCQEYKHIVVFCCTIDHAEILKEMLNKEGESCTTIHSRLTDIERSINMQAWKSGKTRIMASVNILVEGFDFPPLDCLVFARPTLSASLFLQAVGRVLRISAGKENAFLLDLTDNTSRFGTDLDNIKIKIPYAVEKKIQEEQEKSIFKNCHACGIECHKSLLQCMTCGYEWPVPEYKPADMPEMQTVNFEATPPPPPELYEVFAVEFHRHQKKGKPDSVRVEYHNDSLVRSKICSEWLCFDHGGYAAEKAQSWWLKMTDSLIQPASTDEALERIFDCMIRPSHILVGQDGEYARVIEHYFDGHTEKKEYVRDEDIPF